MIDPAKQEFMTYDRYIDRGNMPDSKGSVNDRKRLIIIILMVLTVAGTIVGCIFSFNKYKQEEEMLSFKNGVYDAGGNWIATPDVKKPDIPEIVRIEPSAEILSSPILSGQFQIGEYIYTLPLKMGSLLDSGLIVYDTPEWNRKGDMELFDTVLSKKTQHEVIMKYDDYTYFYVYTFNDLKDESIMDSTVVAVQQCTDTEWWNNNAQYVYLPGGLHVGLDGDSAAHLYDIGDGNLKVSAMGNKEKQYNYNGSASIIKSSPMNYIQFTVSSTNNNTVDKTLLYRNY